MDCDRLAAWLDPMFPHVAQRYPVSRVHRFAVRGEAGGYRIEQDGVACGVEATAESAGYALTSRIHAVSLSALPAFTKVHAGCASWQGRRLLAVGPPEAGKTTLMTRLAHEGFDVHGDELVLVSGATALPYPRRFGVRAATVGLIPQLAARRPGAPAAPLVTDPADLGFEWTIEPGPVTAIFYLEPDHGRASRVAPCPKYLMAHQVMGQSTGPAGGTRPWIRDVCDMVDSAATYTLVLGDLDGAVTAVTRVMRGLSAAAA